MNFLWIPVGLAVALWAPRRPFAVLTSLIAALGLAVLLQLLFNASVPVLVPALALPAVLLGFVVFARRWQRPLMPLLIFAACQISVATTPGMQQPGRVVIFTMLGIFLALAVVGTWRVRWGLRIACAAIGARLLLLGLPWESNRWVLLGVMAALLVASAFTARGLELKLPEMPSVLRVAGGAAAVMAIALLALPFLAPELPAPADAAHAARLARLKEKRPAGGLVWSLPSEAMTWEGEHAFPWFENLDALYLNGRTAAVTVARVPGTSPLTGAFSLHDAVADLRMRKDETEMAALRAAAQATVNALKETLPQYRAGVTERELAASIQQRQKAHGAEGDSFPPIVASGPRGAKPHQFEHTGTLETGQLVVTDIGAYKDHYASDFTRTLPVGGKFDERTRRLYTAVYESQQAALRACKPGAVMYGKAKDGTPGLDKVSREALEKAGVAPKYPHGLGHTVGLFVHDVQGNRPLEPGMVLTLEPGHYLPGELGIRIEDTYVVTETGCESITTGFPADPDSVEAMMAEAFKVQAAQGSN
jgi:Xaa-Pro aminopeptidase